MISKAQLILELRKAGIKNGDILNLKVSLKAIGKMENGPLTLMEALTETVGPEGTLVSDAFIAPQLDLPFIYKNKITVDNTTASYAGGFANTMIKYPSAERSRHPVQKFAVYGNLATELANSHTADSFGYDILKKISNLNAKNVKIGEEEKVPGVGTTHIAICDLNFEQKRMPRAVNYLDSEGSKKKFKVNWVGGCGFGFRNLMPVFQEKGAVLYKGMLGNAPLLITDMKSTLSIELEKLESNPELILCKNPDCLDCRISWSFSDSTYFKYMMHQLLKKNIKNLRTAIQHLFFSKRIIGSEHNNRNSRK